MKRFGQEVPEFSGKCSSDNALELLKQYPFPGNVRELKNSGRLIAKPETSSPLRTSSYQRPTRASRPGLSKGASKLWNAKLVEEALERSGGNQAQASR